MIAKRRGGIRFGLAGLLLTMAVVASWLPFVMNQRTIARLRRQNEQMRLSGGMLLVEDPTEIAVIETLPVEYQVKQWSLYLPQAASYRLRLATRGITGEGFPEPVATVRLTPGRHTIRLSTEEAKGEGDPSAAGSDDSESGHVVRVWIDDREVMTHREDSEWQTTGSSSATGDASTRRQVEIDLEEPLVLIRRRFHEPVPGKKFGSKSPDDDQSANGVLLWIECPPQQAEPRSPL